jgi:hypothetical protein
MFTNLAPEMGTNYYHVKQVDKDGNLTHSPVATVVLSQAGVLWSVYPNPAKEKATLYAQGMFFLKIYSAKQTTTEKIMVQ